MAIFGHLLKGGLIYQCTKHYQLLLSSGWLVDALVCLKKQAHFILLINWGQACSFKHRSWMTSFNSGLHQSYSSFSQWKARKLYHSYKRLVEVLKQPTFLACKLDFILILNKERHSLSVLRTHLWELKCTGGTKITSNTWYCKIPTLHSYLESISYQCMLVQTHFQLHIRTHQWTLPEYLEGMYCKSGILPGLCPRD